MNHPHACLRTSPKRFGDAVCSDCSQELIPQSAADLREQASAKNHAAQRGDNGETPSSEALLLLLCWAANPCSMTEREVAGPIYPPPGSPKRGSGGTEWAEIWSAPAAPGRFLVRR